MNNDISKTAVACGSMDFFHYLQERPAERFSRFEAYIYMLDKACANYRPENIEKKWIPAIGDAQFFITKTELANDWHWHRATVRDFLARLQEFGCLVIEEHLKGILCTMTRLTVTFNSSVAVCYNFDSMAKYALYSWADGRLKPYQMERIIRQMERSANTMLDGTVVSAYAEKQLENIAKMVIHYAIEAIIAHHPGNLASAKEIGCSPMLVEKRALEFFTEHLGGSWVAFLSLLFKKTEVALGFLCKAMHSSRSDRTAIYQQLYHEAASLKDVPLDPLPEPTAESDGPDAYADGSPSDDSASVSSDKHSESDTESVAASVSSPSSSPSK